VNYRITLNKSHRWLVPLGGKRSMTYAMGDIYAITWAQTYKILLDGGYVEGRPDTVSYTIRRNATTQITESMAYKFFAGFSKPQYGYSQMSTENAIQMAKSNQGFYSGWWTIPLLWPRRSSVVMELGLMPYDHWLMQFIVMGAYAYKAFPNSGMYYDVRPGWWARFRMNDAEWELHQDVVMPFATRRTTPYGNLIYEEYDETMEAWEQTRDASLPHDAATQAVQRLATAGLVRENLGRLAPTAFGLSLCKNMANNAYNSDLRGDPLDMWNEYLGRDIRSEIVGLMDAGYTDWGVERGTLDEPKIITLEPGQAVSQMAKFLVN